MCVGLGVGLAVGLAVGSDVGPDVGVDVAVGVGLDVGFWVGSDVGCDVGGAVVGVGLGSGFEVGFGAGVRDGRCVGRETTGWPGDPVSVAPGARVGTTSGPELGGGEASPLGEAIAPDGDVAGVVAGDDPGEVPGEDGPISGGVGPSAVVVWLGVVPVAAGEPAAVPGVAPAARSGALRSATLTASATETRSTLMMPRAMTARRRWAAVTSMRTPGAGGAAGIGAVSRW